MREKVLKKEALQDFLRRLIATAKTVAPVRQPGKHYMLKPVSRAEEVAVECPLTYYSPKEFVLPPGETLLCFGRRDGKPFVKPMIEAEDMILFGLHPCDINAMWTYDAAFESDNKDENYLARRNRMTVVGMDCLKPCDEYAFCYDMKTNVVQGRYDLFLTDIGDSYFVRVATDRGARLLGGAPSPSSQQKAELAKVEKAKESSFTKRIEFETDELPQLLEKSYDSLVWNAVARRCYSCGSCVLVCPTCYCFNVEDRLQLNLAAGERKRYWDGCMLAGFAEVAGGENFRRERWQRLRHRLFRKGKLIKELFNRPGCVGCGRCERACTSKISIVATYNQLKGGA